VLVAPSRQALAPDDFDPYNRNSRPGGLVGQDVPAIILAFPAVGGSASDDYETATIS
jgi:hypothetical protein